MSEDQLKSNIVPSIIAGVISGIIKIVIATAFSALIFTGTLAPYLSQGIGIVLFGFFISKLLKVNTYYWKNNCRRKKTL